MTVKEMIDHLSKFKSDMPIVIRRGYEKGYFADFHPHKPSEFFPGGQICLSAGEQVKNEDQAG